MKNLITIVFLAGLFVSSAFTIYSLNKYSNVFSYDEPICTMEYEPVCGIDGKTYGNKCTVGNKEIDYIGECINYKPTKKQVETLDKIIEKLKKISDKKGKDYVEKVLYAVQEKVLKKDNLKHIYYIQKLITGISNHNGLTQKLPIEPIIDIGPGRDDETGAIVCTSDAKQCLDGTYVGRIGPKCEFAKCPGKLLKPDFVPTKENPIKLPENIISDKECTAAGGEVWNTLGETSYNGELIGKIEGYICPCACLVKGEKENILWVNINGNIEEFSGNLDDIKTYDDCKKAGFRITDDIPATCTVGESYMTGGKWKTFTDNPMEVGKTCKNYTYSNCPGSCVAKCASSSCSETQYGTVCTSDCDGKNSCIEK